MLRFGFGLVVVLGLIGCTSQKTQKIDNLQVDGIINGEMVMDKDALQIGIVGIYDLENNAICTGSLVQENIVLTAAHCLQDVPKGKLRVVFGLNVDSLMATREPDIFRAYVMNVEEYIIHEKYGTTPEDQEFDQYDIALIKFRGKAPEGYTPVKMLPSMSYLKAGQKVLLAGYGVSEMKTEKVDPKDVKDFEDALMYGEIFCFDEENTDCVTIESSGEGELRKTTSSISGIVETEVILDEKNSGTCFGDSGGPAYIVIDNEPYLFGITSRGSALCNELGVYTNALTYTEWIEDNILNLWY